MESGNGKGQAMSIRDLQVTLEGFEKKPESRGYDLRLSLSELVIRCMKAKGWTQKQLAQAAGMKEPFVTRVLHADQNCTFDVAGRLLFALGIRAHLQEAAPPGRVTSAAASSGLPGHVTFPKRTTKSPPKPKGKRR